MERLKRMRSRVLPELCSRRPAPQTQQAGDYTEFLPAAASVLHGSVVKSSQNRGKRLLTLRDWLDFELETDLFGFHSKRASTTPATAREWRRMGI